MKRRAGSLKLVGAVMLATAPAFGAGPRVVREPDKVIVRKHTTVDFDEVTVDGELKKPEGSYVLDRSRARFGSVIRLRDNFDAELRASADHL